MPFPLDFDLPAQLIAQHPLARRDHARLMVVRRQDQTLAHHRFDELPSLLRCHDLLIVNNTRVLPARLVGRRPGGGKWEGLCLGAPSGRSWEMLCKGRMHPGEVITLDPAAAAPPGTQPAQIRVLARIKDARWLVASIADQDVSVLLETHGRVPLPPYIRKGQEESADRERYQTVYAQRGGAIAAPTAGLHFTPQLFESLRQAGIAKSEVTLHVGLGTFQPIKAEDVTQHVMHEEWGELPAETVLAVQTCRAAGGRVAAVGTTSVRVLETAAALREPGELRPWSGQTKLFIYPPYRFLATDVLLTNFHLPRSTLLLLVSAFAGTQLLEAAYRSAIAEKYRFFSYGDAMLIL